MGSPVSRYVPIEHAPVKRGDRDPTEHWVGCVVISRWEDEDGCYLESYDEDWNGELEDDRWFPDATTARQHAIDRFGALLGSWRPGGPTLEGREAARASGDL